MMADCSRTSGDESLSRGLLRARHPHCQADQAGPEGDRRAARLLRHEVHQKQANQNHRRRPMAQAYSGKKIHFSYSSKGSFLNNTFDCLLKI